MKLLQIGLGSMGKRRIRNLQYLGYSNNIIGFDTRNDRLQESKELYGIEVIKNLNEIDINSITHISVSTPPDQHIDYAIWAIENNKHVFIEASVIDDKYSKLLSLSKKKNVIVAPSCTMRFDPLNKKVKEILDSNILGKSIFLQHHFGLYLPYWHPYESIKDFYVSNRNTGAAREIVPFDLVYISWFIGYPQKNTLSALITKTNFLDIDIDDIYSLQYKTENNCHVQFTIDVVSKQAYRTTRIICEHGNIELDTVKGILSVYNAKDDVWKLYNRQKLSKTTSTEEMYVIEMKTFIEASEGIKPWPYSLEEDWKILKCLYSAENSYHKIME